MPHNSGPTMAEQDYSNDEDWLCCSKHCYATVWNLLNLNSS